MNPLELDSEFLLEGCRQSLEIIAVHGESVRVALVADDLVTVSGDGPVVGCGPPSLDRSANDYHGSIVCGVPIFHGLEGGDYLIVVVGVVQCQDVPAI